MNYKLKVNEKDVSSFIYSMLEVYWLSESLASLKILKDSYGISPIYIERGSDIYFLMKIDKSMSIGYYIQSNSMEKLILDSIDDELKISAIYASITTDSSMVDSIMESCLVKIINGFSKNPTIYKSIPYPVKLGEKLNE